MTKHPPTAEQQACIDAAVGTKDNLIIQALAGAAKTSTLVLLAEALPKTDILCLAFNKKIAMEMRERLPDNCESSTLNALGHRIWADKISTRLNLNTKKMYNLTREAIDEIKDTERNRLAWKAFKDLLATAKEAKSRGYIPDTLDRPKDRPNPVVDGPEFYSTCEFRLSGWEQDLVDKIVVRSINAAFSGTIDFDDQIYMPSCFKAIFPIKALVMVDEAQDLSELNHRFLRKLARSRLIAVGDPCQAIYGFRGAHEESMSILRKEFNMTPLTLTTSFRCPQAIIEHVHWRAPEMKWWEGHPNNADGQVQYGQEWAIADIPDNAAIICRNNAPLYKMAITFLKHGRTPKLASGDIGKGLIPIMKKFGPGTMKREDAKQEVRQWLWEQEQRTRSLAAARDKADCMEIFIDATDTLEQAIAFAQDILNYDGAIQFMTGHKSKGLEFPEVFFLDNYLVSDEGQDPNLRYVICTRATRILTYIETDMCADMEQGDE